MMSCAAGLKNHQFRSGPDDRSGAERLTVTFDSMENNIKRSSIILLKSLGRTNPVYSTQSTKLMIKEGNY